MKFSIVAIATIAGLASALPSQPEARATTVQGFDISNHQKSVNFEAAEKDGAQFVMIKATEGTTYKDTVFNSHYTGATKAGLLRGGYHFARPDKSTGSTQAKFFLKNGSGWSDDNRTLPGMLDIEYNPYGATCYGLSHSQMVAWIHDFVNEYHHATSRWPMIYTTADWWNRCTGNAKGFGDKCPLVLAAYSSSPPKTIPGDWKTWTIWQNSDKYKHGGDSDKFNGPMTQLRKLASG
ncbi:hypothetical protein KXX55_005581 [Aspergillus fumigatus]|nr:hypothetical protein KXX55_005581 [Aspergillus fumigatus]KAH1993597.1 hypothetical protein KXV33_004178 [Aspergillus fumigatus]KAH3052920.1 hypothetical protein KXW01_007356 [Aspergillus fumigatus]